MDSKDLKNPATEDNSPSVSQTEYLRGLAEIVSEEDLCELEVETAGVRVTLKAPELFTAVTQLASVAPATGVVPVMPGIPEGAVVTTPPAVAEENLIEIVSPMVGVFYRAPSPSDPNFVEIGDKIEVGQTVALVEAMKVFNEIIAEAAGTVVEIKPQGSDLVETGQVLITLRP